MTFKPLGRNPNRHKPRGMQELARSMTEDGYTEPMVAAADHTVIAGNARLEVAGQVFAGEPIIVETDGTRPIIHVRTDIATADTPEARRIAIRSNRVAELNLAWDADVLRESGDEELLRSLFDDTLLAEATISASAAPQPAEELVRERHSLVEPRPATAPEPPAPAVERRYYPLPIVLERPDLTRWEAWKARCGTKSDIEAFKQALEVLSDA